MNSEGRAVAPVGGLAGWLLGKLRRGQQGQRRLALVERIALAPRQSLALVEAEGRRFLVATSQDGAPSFYPLDEARPARQGEPVGKKRKLQDPCTAGPCASGRAS